MKSGVLLVALTALCSLTAWAPGEAAEVKAGAAKAAAAPGEAVDLEAAARIFQKTCRACHGNKAQGASSFPRLSDKSAKYIAAKLKRYRAGETFGPESSLMNMQAGKLSDKEIASLAVYVTTAFR